MPTDKDKSKKRKGKLLHKDGALRILRDFDDADHVGADGDGDAVVWFPDDDYHLIFRFPAGRVYGSRQRWLAADADEPLAVVIKSDTEFTYGVLAVSKDGSSVVRVKGRYVPSAAEEPPTVRIPPPP